jgi:hypothetical protein
MLRLELENNSRQPEYLTEQRQSDSLNKSLLTLSHGVDEGGGIVDEDDDGREPIKLVTGPCNSNSGYLQILAQNLV